MNHPTLVLLRMLACLLVLGGAAWPLGDGLLAAFFHNPGLNGLVAGVFVVGIGFNLHHVTRLGPDSAWLDVACRGAAASGSPESLQIRRTQGPGGLLSSLLPWLNDDGQLKPLPGDARQAVLDGVAGRLEEQRELARYFIGLLIFLGLLGTFWGLSRAVGSMGEVIRSLSMEGGDANAAFERLKDGMEAPLGGMGMAFSTSLFGLAGSLVLGFLDLQAGQAQNAFYRRVEEWLAAIPTPAAADVPSAVVPMSLPAANPAYLTALLERTAERMDQLAAAQQASHRTCVALTDMMTLVTEHLRANQAMSSQQAETERHMQMLLTRLIEETVASRDHLSEQLQAELRLLARTLTAPIEPEA